MTQPFADALTWVPKSRALGATLGRAHDLARAQGHALVTLEHLLLALIEDPDAAAVLLACNIDLLSLNAAATTQVQQMPAHGAEMPEAAPGLQLILEYAVAAARQSRRTEVNGAIVLAAIVGEGKSEAARMLHALGITFEGTVQALRRASVPRPAAGEEAPAAVQEVVARPAPEPQPRYRPQPSEPSVAAPVQAAFDDDPVTTARRRIQAIRTGQPLPAAPANLPPVRVHEPAPSELSRRRAQQQSAMPRGNEPPSDWAPQPHAPPAIAARPVRMPPPVPPIVAPPMRQNGGAPGNGAFGHAHAPWADANPAAPTDVQPAYPPARLGPPVDPARVMERVPTRMRPRTPVTVEARMARSSVLGTLAALNAAAPDALTRAVTVRLKAPAGGFHVEPAAPETQWLDTRTAQREDDEVRWRWVVTPHGRGKHPLQLSIAIRTITADGIMIESVLPEQQVGVRIARDYGPVLRTCGGWLAAAILGASLALLGTGGWSAVLMALRS